MLRLVYPLPALATVPQSARPSCLHAQRDARIVCAPLCACSCAGGEQRGVAAPSAPPAPASPPPVLTPQRIFSGMQPSGRVHLGNYLGAVRLWTQLQAEQTRIGGERPLFCVVDLHSLTTEAGRHDLARKTLHLTAALLACGVDPVQSVVYVQSRLGAHAELCWLLSCVTPMHQLNTMVQYKEKAKTQSASNVALYNYPTLMAADILVHAATHVPVGHDQAQHMELARYLADRVNREWAGGECVLPVPATIDAGSAARVMNLRDGESKMSKSDLRDHASVHLDDSDDELARTIRLARTDSHAGVSYEPERRPQIANLLEIFAALEETPTTPREVAARYAKHDMGHFKAALLERLLATIRPIRTRMAELEADPSYLAKVLVSGANEARRTSEPTMRRLRDLLGLL